MAKKKKKPKKPWWSSATLKDLNEDLAAAINDLIIKGKPPKHYTSPFKDKDMRKWEEDMREEYRYEHAQIFKNGGFGPSGRL